MHIQSMTLQHFRSAVHLQLDLHGRMNIFLGMNGAGKSSVLDASAILLSWLMNRIKQSGASGRPITEPDITNHAHSAKLEMALSTDAQEDAWWVTKTRHGKGRKSAPSNLSGASNYANRLQSRIEDSEGGGNLPLFLYYPVNRAVLDIPLRIRKKHSFDQFSAYEDALTSGANFRTFFEWFREREDLENEKRRDSQGLLATSAFTLDPQLEAVRSALNTFMPEFRNLTVRRSPLRMEVEKSGACLTVNQLSDGEKCLMSMIGDLARRFAILNPTRGNPLEGDGIVLIDEIDLHLHPTWQRMVIPKLLEVFPNCQFLISTHSPHVITHAHPENLFLLALGDEGLTALRPGESYGKTVERILEDLMGLDTTRPDAVTRKLNGIYRLIQRGEFEKAQNKIRRLQGEIGEDPDLVSARVLIRRKELIGK